MATQLHGAEGSAVLHHALHHAYHGVGITHIYNLLGGFSGHNGRGLV